MSDSITLPAVWSRNETVIHFCRWRIKTFVERDAYAAYDYAAGYARPCDDTIQPFHIDAINSFWAMRARSSRKAWQQFIGEPLPEMKHIPRDLDLIDDSKDAIELGIAALRQLVERIAAVNGLTEMGATKVLHLMRPRFVPIADSYVRDALGIYRSSPPDSVAAIQRALRGIAEQNREELDSLCGFGESLGSVTVQRGPYEGKTVPITLSKIRILDILLWTEVAIHGKQPHPEWSVWFKRECQGTTLAEDFCDSLREAFDIVPEKRGGIPVLKGTRFKAAQFLAQLAEGDSISDLEKQLELNRETMTSFLRAMSAALDRPWTTDFN